LLVAVNACPRHDGGTARIATSPAAHRDRCQRASSGAKGQRSLEAVVAPEQLAVHDEAGRAEDAEALSLFGVRPQLRFDGWLRGLLENALSGLSELAEDAGQYLPASDVTIFREIGAIDSAHEGRQPQ